MNGIGLEKGQFRLGAVRSKPDALQLDANAQKRVRASGAKLIER